MSRICTQRDGQDRFARSELDTPGHCRSRIACGASARQPIITRDVTEEPRWKPWLWLANEFDYRACWSFPVETSSGIVGILPCISRSLAKRQKANSNSPQC